MTQGRFQKLKLGVIKIALEIIVFIDFLEDLPQKTFRIFVYALLLAIVIIFSFLGYIGEKKTSIVHDIISSVFINNFEAVALDLSHKYPILKQKLPVPLLTARAVLVADVTRDKVLYENNSHTPLPPASTTKLMTALVARDLYSLDDILVVPKHCTEVDSSKLGLFDSELASVTDLLHSMLISSSGDAACVLANGKGNEHAFVVQMNQKAATLGLTATNFANPVGLDDYSVVHLSSAQDLYKLAKVVRSDSFLQQIVGIKEYSTVSGQVTRKLLNTNDLLWDVPGTVGIKTGRTYGAGEVLIYEYKENNVDLIIVVMGSLDRFKDTQLLLDWTLESYDFGSAAN